MSTNAFNPIHSCHNGAASLRRRSRRHSISSPSHQYLPKPHVPAIRTLPQPPSSSRTIQTTTETFAVSTSDQGVVAGGGSAVSFDVLRQHLAAGDWRQADEETRRLLIVLAGEAAEKRGYVFFSEVQFMAEDDLRSMDSLWREHSGGRFGYSVQKRIWEKSNREFTKFFIKVGWMKKLEASEVEQYNYRAFPAEFTWDVAEAAEGHLPLTNALRGTQLLTAILTHPAFDDEPEGEGSEPVSGKEVKGGPGGSGIGFKPNYSF